jgi:uncharacterized protein (TIGR02284 family)
MAMEQTAPGQTVDQLNSFLRGELSAVDTYRQALQKIKDPSLANTLQQCMTSHQQRADQLTQRVRALGGSPATESGVWGSFAKLITGGAALFGEKAAIAALEEGEEHGLKDYRRDLSQLDVESRRLVEMQILPEQERTHRTISSLKQGLTGMAPSAV